MTSQQTSPTPGTHSIGELIQSNARRNPDALALLAAESLPITYGQLLNQVEYVGRALRALGVGQSDRVAVVLPNGPNMATAFVGIASHATCAPLNPAYLDDAIEFYLTDLEAKAVVVPADTDLPARDVATRMGLTVVSLEPSVEHAGGFTFKDVAADRDASAEWGSEGDIALVLHTSGTTSRPKQVPLSHKNLCASAHNVASLLELSPDDRCLNVMPLFHIHGLVGVLLSSMCAGASVVCSSGFDHDTFADLMNGFEPTWYSAVPTIHQSILALARQNDAVAECGRNGFRLIRSSSSSLPPTVMADLEEMFGVPVIESYGMTEAAHQMASNPLPPLERKPGSVGLPAGPEMAITDDDGNLLPADKVGEIVIRGINVTNGYVNNPQANHDAFTNGWFRTGDRGYTDGDGYFHISGRTKEMINRGGENISPREIDEVLLEHDAVAQAVAFAVGHATLGEDVVAAVVLHEGQDVSEPELRQHTFDRLAAFKVPSRILTVDAIPKGPTGKLQRIGLHVKFEDELRTAYVEPRTDLERTVVAAFEQVLEKKTIGATDNFFSRGGDSLKAARVLAQLCAEYQVELPAVSLFMNPTAVSLGLEITRLLGENAGVLESLLAEIENMSDEETQRKLD